jgi:cell division septation protein DedD
LVDVQTETVVNQLEKLSWQSSTHGLSTVATVSDVLSESVKQIELNYRQVLEILQSSAHELARVIERSMVPPQSQSTLRRALSSSLAPPPLMPPRSLVEAVSLGALMADLDASMAASSSGDASLHAAPSAAAAPSDAPSAAAAPSAAPSAAAAPSDASSAAAAPSDASSAVDSPTYDQITHYLR